jgi:hypothetical protein
VATTDNYEPDFAALGGKALQSIGFDASLIGGFDASLIGGPGLSDPKYKGKSERDKDLSEYQAEGKKAAELFKAGINSVAASWADGPFGSSMDFSGDGNPLGRWLQGGMLEQYVDGIAEQIKPYAADAVKALFDFEEQQRANAARTAAWKAKTGATDIKDQSVGQRDAVRHTSMVQNMFGSIDEINGYREAFDALTSGVTSGYEAMVTGSMSFGKAFKTAVAGALLASGKEMAVNAIKSTAFGLAALATGGPIAGLSASQYFASAAMFTAGAAAAGIAANALGVGGGSAASSGARGAGAASQVGRAGTASATPYQGRHEVIILSDSFGDNTARAKQREFRRRSESAYGSPGVAFR